MTTSYQILKKEIDQLGHLMAEAAELKEKIDELKESLILLIPAGERAEGELFGASHSHTERATVAWKAIAAKLKASRQIITANTTTKPVDTIRVTARKIA